MTNQMLFGLLQIAACVLLQSGCERSAPARVKSSFHSEAGHIYDQTSIVDTGSFSEARLAISFRQILGEKAPRFALIRWTVGPDKGDVARAVGGPGCWFGNPGSFDGDWRRTSKVAQFVYVNGAVIERIKNGEEITTRILKGDADPFGFRVDGAPIQLKSVYIHRDSGAGNPLVQFYAFANPLPSIQQAEETLKTLIRIADVHWVGLVVRSDSMFGRYDGPAFDPFDPPYEDFNEKTYLSRPYVGCTTDQQGANVHCAYERLQPLSPLADCM
jgi:hypothetical protein